MKLLGRHIDLTKTERYWVKKAWFSFFLTGAIIIVFGESIFEAAPIFGEVFGEVFSRIMLFVFIECSIATVFFLQEPSKNMNPKRRRKK